MPFIARRAEGLARRFGEDARGGIMIVFALAAMTVVGIAGVAIDYAHASRMKRMLSNAADSAVLAATRTALDLDGQGGTADSGIIEAAVQQANLVWAANISNESSLSSPTTSVDVQRVSGVWTATMSFSATIPTSFGGIFGVPQIAVQNTAVSKASLGQSYLDIYLLLDSSQSMGLAATAAGQSQMLSATGCQFGCHVPGQDGNYNMMRSQGIPMRIDVVRDAAGKLLDDASAAAGATVRAGLWTFDAVVTKLADLTNNLASVKTAAAAVDLPTFEDGTQTDDALTQMTGTIPDSGNGYSQAQSKKFLFLITDGTQDGIYTGWPVPSALLTSNNGYSAGAITPTACDALKAKGVTVAVLYTTYVPFPGQWQYDGIIAPGAGKIPANMQSCASPGFFIEASDADAIRSAMGTLLSRAIAATSGVRVTQ